MLKAGTDSGKVADIVESVLAEATREHEEQERQHLAEVEAAAEVKLARLLDASPAVIYSFKAKDDFAPFFVSENITRLFGYAVRKYSRIPIFGASACTLRILRASRPRSKSCSRKASTRSNIASAARTAPNEERRKLPFIRAASAARRRWRGDDARSPSAPLSTTKACGTCAAGR
jgi:hypothetical protein